MILRRLGNKSNIASEIIKYFPKHSTYIELFFGAGGMLFNKPRAKYNFLNDLDSDVYNCFDVLMRKKEELSNYVEMMPYHSDFWSECKIRDPCNEVERAVYFLTLSNFGYMGKRETIKFSTQNTKDILLANIEKTYIQLVQNGNMFLNCDFREVIPKISFRKESDKANTFIYSDPPYLDTDNNYNMDKKWNEQDVCDCLNSTFNNGIKAAMSEFNHPFIVEQSKQRGLNIIEIGERCNLKNRRVEILITNYENQNKLKCQEKTNT